MSSKLSVLILFMAMCACVAVGGPVGREREPQRDDLIPTLRRAFRNAGIALAQWRDILPSARDAPRMRTKGSVLYAHAQSNAEPQRRIRRSTDSEGYWYDARDYPHPRTSQSNCHMVGVDNNYICNPDGVITAEEAILLQHQIEALVNTSRCLCDPCSESGGKLSIAIALFNHLRETEFSVKSEMEVFSETLRTQNWKDLNQCDNLIVMSVDSSENVVTTSLGTKAYEEVGDACLGVGGSPQNPQSYPLLKGHYYPGLRAMIEQFGDCQLSRQSITSDLTVGEIVAIAVCGVIALILLFFLISCICFCCQCCMCCVCICSCIGSCLGCCKRIICCCSPCCND